MTDIHVTDVGESLMERNAQTVMQIHTLDTDMYIALIIFISTS